MAAVYEDNFGYYDLEADPDEAAFFAFVKAQSNPRKCLRCSEPGKLQPGAQKTLRPLRRRAGIWRGRVSMTPSPTPKRLSAGRSYSKKQRKGA